LSRSNLLYRQGWEDTQEKNMKKAKKKHEKHQGKIGVLSVSGKEKRTRGEGQKQ